MGKPKRADRSSRTWQPKTKTPKARRCGRNAAAHHKHPVIRLQTPVDPKVPYQGLTATRAAFDSAVVPEGGHPLIPKLLRALRSKAGTYQASGWNVIRTRGVKHRGKRSGKRSVS